MEKTIFKSGDVVYLLSGGRPMVATDRIGHLAYCTRRVYWMDDSGKMLNADIPESCLRLATKEELGGAMEG